MTEEITAKKHGNVTVEKSVPKESFRFKRNLSQSVIKKFDLEGIYNGIDFLIVTTVPPLNPMTMDGINFWSWGLLTINEVSIPAPYKEFGYNANSLRIDLSDKSSAVTNTYIWLEILLSLKSLPADQISIINGIYLYPSFDWIDRIGEDNIREIQKVLYRKAMEDPNAYRILA